MKENLCIYIYDKDMNRIGTTDKWTRLNGMIRFEWHGRKYWIADDRTYVKYKNCLVPVEIFSILSDKKYRI